MSNELRSLLARVKDTDPDTAKELRRHIDLLHSRRQFGLNFERHTPESVALTGRAISIGDKVRFLPPRGETEVESKTNWIVTTISGPKSERVASLLNPRTKEEVTRCVNDLVFVADFRDPIYPGLVSTGKVERGDDNPFHAVINAENYHALEAMLFTHRGTVDCIYIDPPYNSGARDWKYNNDYVDGEDSYRHSKWLAFMERRLKVARKLLNPRDSVLIVTIDEKEYLKLGLLLEQVFPEARMQMVSSLISPKGSARSAELYRVDEYIFILQFGASKPARLDRPGMVVTAKRERANRKTVEWESLMRRGSNSYREDREKMFFPIFVDPVTKQVVEVGDVVPMGTHHSEVPAPKGLLAAWPIRTNGREGRWMAGPQGFKRWLEQGFARVSNITKAGKVTISYLPEGKRQLVANGDIELTGQDANGYPVYEYVDEDSARGRIRTQWNVESHNASEHGTTLVDALIPSRNFIFPKSLYAVEDVLSVFLQGKPFATVLDFFSGSGTTAHAVMRLNRQDGGRRQSISVTNNEVSADEQKRLTKRGFRAGDAEWEALGICNYITKPRIEAAVTGQTSEGDPVKGEYKFVDEFLISDGLEANVEFFTLTYENPALVELDMAFERIAPLLWMRAGSEGRRIDQRRDAFDVADTYAVLFNVDASKPFLTAVEHADGLRIAYIVTDDESQYQAVAGQLPQEVESVRLYESYLRTFQINTGRV